MAIAAVSTLNRRWPKPTGNAPASISNSISSRVKSAQLTPVLTFQTKSSQTGNSPKRDAEKTLPCQTFGTHFHKDT
jgi:hypothetical protein